MNPATRIILLGTTDADAREWAGRAGNVTSNTLQAVSRFVRGAKGAGIWSKFSRINLIAGEDLTAARTPLIVGGGSATETVTNIVAADYVQNGTTGGIKGNGTDKSFDTGWNPIARSASTSSFGMFAYVRGTESGATTRLIIASNGAAEEGTFLGWATGGTVEIGSVASLGAEYAPGVIVTADTAAKEGFLGVTVNGSRAQQYYYNGSAVGAPVTASSSFANQSLYGLARNNNGVAASFATRYLCAYAITTGMSAADAAAFNSIMQEFQDKLGRRV